MIVERLRPEASIEVTVTEGMQAAFGDEVIHPVYGTASMVGHMELAARQVILPAREPHEEGIGHRVEVTHLAPAPVGSRITVTARLGTVNGNRVTCEVEARTWHGVIGQGTITQVILPREILQRRFAEFGGETK
ncbi:MAG TPA: hotdog domain-containing protein [Chloroflexota bacterium]|nr:hotdog domain-containing protein [Chloroflexota bacterium]